MIATIFANMMMHQNLASNAEIGMVNGYNSLANLSFKAAKCGNLSNMDSFQKAEKNLILQNQQNYVAYMMHNQLKQSCEKLLAKNIKEEFSFGLNKQA